MYIESLKFDDVHYNPEQDAFEALVHIRDANGEFTYPVQFCAPLTSEFLHISKGIRQKALFAHRHAAPGLRLRKAAFATSARPSQLPEPQQAAA